MHSDEYVSTVLPVKFVREDRAWIQEQLSLLPVGMRGKIASEYARVFIESFEAEPVSFRQENAARRAANKRLREFCTQYSPAVRGYTVSPPTVNQYGRPNV